MNQPLAYIHPEAKIADNVIIEPFAMIHKNVVIEEGTWIGSNAIINEGARIGKNCKIFPGAVISSIPQDLKFKGEETTTVIGDNTVVREFVTISRGTVDKHTTVIGKDCLIMAYVHIAHDCVIGNNVILVNAVQLAGHVHVNDFAIIGGATVIHQFVRIGAHVIIAGGSLIGKDVPPFTKAAREPLRYCGINTVGLKRRGFTNDKINEIQEVYRHLYMSGLNTTAAVQAIELQCPTSKERDEIVSFVRHSERGIMKGMEA